MGWVAVFPGQGSQHVGMGEFFFKEFPIAQQTFEEASDAISLDLAKLCFRSSEADLSLTANTQPALLTTSIATLRVLRETIGFRPRIVSGHSVGEYAALVAAEAMEFADAVRAVRKRGELMQSATPLGLGAMAAILGWSDEQVRKICAWATENSNQGILEPANFNCPGQVVISGHKACLDWTVEHFNSEAFTGAPARLKLIPLKVSAPFHCSLMAKAEEGMREHLKPVPLHSPTATVVQNFSAAVPKNSDELREALIRQVSSPVRWVECIEKVCELGGERAVEVGAGKVLAGLIKKIAGDRLPVWGMQSLEDLKVLEGVHRG